MYTTSSEYKAAVASDIRLRSIRVKAIFNGTIELDGKHIMSISFNETMGTTKFAVIGQAVMNKVTISMRMPDEPIALTNGTVAPFVGVALPDDSVEYVPLGLFFITEPVTPNDFQTLTFTAYAQMCKFEKPYETTIEEWPASISDVVADIASLRGVGVKAGITFPDYMVDYRELSCREYIGYIAGMMGKNARFDRNGELEFVWYEDSGLTVGRNLQYQGGLVKTSANNFVINSLTTGTESNPIACGSGVGIAYSNPFITQDIANSIFAHIEGAYYAPSNCKWRGDPAVQAGDIITVIDKDYNEIPLWVMEHRMKISGGMNSEVFCYGMSETAIALEKSPTEKKLQKVYTQLMSAITEATHLLNGARCGIFRVTDNDGDGRNDGWTINESADPNVLGKCLVANYEGIGLSTDGGRTYTNAITHDGINANAITSGAISANRISAGVLQSVDGSFTLDLDENIMTMNKSGAETKSIINERGIGVLDKTGASDIRVFYAGFEDGKTIVDTEYIDVKSFIKIGTNSRIQDYGTDRTGIFFVGGD